MIKNVFALCAGSYEGNNPRYAQETRILAAHMGQRPDCVVKFGGALYGLMGVFATSFMDAAKASNSGARMKGIIAEKYYKGEDPAVTGYEIIVTKNPDENNAMFTGPDTEGLLYLQGGSGTFSEMFAHIERDRNMPGGIRPGFFLNTAGYFNYQFSQMNRSIRDGFVPAENVANLHHAPTAKKLIPLIERVMG